MGRRAEKNGERSHFSKGGERSQKKVGRGAKKKAGRGAIFLKVGRGAKKILHWLAGKVGSGAKK